MYNRRIVISESEKQRILGLHENVKNNEWGTLYEQPSRKDVRKNYREYQQQKNDIQSQIDRLYKQIERQGAKMNLPQKEQMDKRINALKAQMSALDVKFGFVQSPGAESGITATDTATLTTTGETAALTTTGETAALTATGNTTTGETTAPVAPTTKEEIQAFQTWLDGKYPTGWAKSTRDGYYYTVGGKPERGYGNFGTNTKAMWEKLGADYTKEKTATTTA
jgi:hypothetical protein